MAGTGEFRAIEPQIAPPTSGQVDSYRWAILVVLTVTQLSASAGTGALPPLMPFIQRDLGLSLAQIGVLSASMYSGYMLTAIPSGWLGDILGVRRVLAAGLLIEAVGLGLALQTDTMAALAILLLGAGLGYGALAPISAKALVDWFPAAGRGTAAGVKQSAVVIGGAAAAATLPALALAFGWRIALLGLAVTNVAMAVLAYMGYRDPGPSPVRERPRVGFLTLLRESLDRNILLLSIMGILFNFMQSSITTYLVLYLKDNWLFPVVLAGSYLALMQLAGAVGRVGWGALSDFLLRGRRRRLMQFIAFANGALALALGLLPVGPPSLALGVLLAFLGTTVLGWHGVKTAFLGDLIGARRAGRVAGVNLTIGHLGTMGGPPLFGLLVDLTHSFQVGWIVIALGGFAAVAVVGMIDERGLKDR